MPTTPVTPSLAATVFATTLVLGAGSARAADPKPLKIGVVTFLSGAAAGPFGVPARQAAELFAAEVNQGGKLPAPYAGKGIGGRPVELVVIDEAGGTTKQVSEFRNLVEQQKVDMVVGYISSGDCLAVAPVAEEMKTLTFLFDCGTPRVFEDGKYDYLFRAVAHATMDNVGAALYINDTNKDFKTYAGINQNYAWGQDSWKDFEGTLKAVRPGATLTTSQMPKLGAGQYNAEISAILASKPDVLHSSFWGGDLEGLVLQGAPRELFKNASVVLTSGETALHRQAKQIPDGTVIGARGPNGVFAPDNAYNRWFRAAYEAKAGTVPSYPAYHMVQSLFAAKAAYERAQEGDAARVPTTEEVARAMTGLTFAGPSGDVRMALGRGHQAIQEMVYGRTRLVDGKITLTDVIRYPAERVNPPEGVTSEAWIKGGLKAR
ncbi:MULTISPECIES: ABC transporter substrate-binding protein [Methylobacteriaceae]|uniref:ABC transporter periplasmic component putative Leu/Ile/Val-binding protein n=1 Tax=Methylorubrum extorquens (strain DSM 6343 / CIP 106787 / DM4) TaxID=661410 RepID=A0A2P9HAY6_METED|nr:MULTISPECIES: ABC transporter substrate-binding protein [Methylobacteriaceae]AYO84729.1 ABC transporter substrate-binding protein [Methylobacterium brachiatum]SPK02062.1 putative ABC transporter periplasmic component; putative Leu/Ile/Val-binding protein [Methylorubrum extorquens DM4]